MSEAEVVLERLIAEYDVPESLGRVAAREGRLVAGLRD
jgi:hypothetical protein